MHELFSPQGSNPLATVKLTNPRCGKIEFERAVRSNVLTIEGDLTQSRIQVPREDRPLSSLQLHHSLLVLQLLIPSSGQFLMELTVSHSPTIRMRLSAATFIARADVVDAKGMAHAKIPLVIPRNSWVQIVFNIGGIFTHLFNLPAVRWIDSVVLAGSCKIRRMLSSADEVSAIESKPPGMLLFAVPAYGPPVWQTAVAREEVKQRHHALPPLSQQQSGDELVASSSEEVSAAPPSSTDGAHTQQNPQQQPGSKKQQQPEISTRALMAKEQHQQQSSYELAAASFAAKSPQINSVANTTAGTSTANGGTEFTAYIANGGASGGVVNSPLKMKFVRADDGSVQFSAKDPVAEAKAEEQRIAAQKMAEKLKIEIEKSKLDAERRRAEREKVEQDSDYVRLVDDIASCGGSGGNGVAGPVSGRRVASLPPASRTAQQDIAGADGNAGSSAAPRRAGPLASVNRTPTAQSLALSAGFDDGANGGVGAWGESDGLGGPFVLAAKGAGNIFTAQRTSIVGGPVQQKSSRNSVVSSGQGALPSSPAASSQQNGGTSAQRGGGGGGQLLAGASSQSTASKRVVLAADKSRRQPQRVPSDVLNSTISLLSTVVQRGPTDVHPADTYDPDERARSYEPEVGYGCGCLDIIHDERLDEEEEEDGDDDDDDVD